MEKQNTLGDRIRFARLVNRITQKTLSESMGVSQTAVKNWENNLNRPHPLRIPMLADVLGVTADELKGK